MSELEGYIKQDWGQLKMVNTLENKLQSLPSANDLAKWPTPFHMFAMVLTKLLINISDTSKHGNVLEIEQTEL